MSNILWLLLSFLLISCNKNYSEFELVTNQYKSSFLKKWEGVYLSSEADNSNKSLIVLYIINNQLNYISRIPSDILNNDIDNQEYYQGTCVVLKDYVYFARANGYLDQNKNLKFLGTFTRYRIETSKENKKLVSEYIDSANKTHLILELSKIEELKREGPDMPPVNNLKKILSRSVK